MKEGLLSTKLTLNPKGTFNNITPNIIPTRAQAFGTETVHCLRGEGAVAGRGGRR